MRSHLYSPCTPLYSPLYCHYTALMLPSYTRALLPLTHTPYPPPPPSAVAPQVTKHKTLLDSNMKTLERRLAEVLAGAKARLDDQVTPDA